MHIYISSVDISGLVFFVQTDVVDYSTSFICKARSIVEFGGKRKLKRIPSTLSKEMTLSQTLVDIAVSVKDRSLTKSQCS